MSRVCVFVSSVGAIAAAASAQPRIDVPILRNGVDVFVSAQSETDGSPLATRSVGVVYDSLVFEGSVQTPMTGPGGSITEDYASVISSPSTLATFQFVGGVETAGTVIYFDFYDSGSNFVDSFGVRLPTAGFTSIWTINLSDPTLITVPAQGFLELRADDGTNNNGLGPTNAAWRFKDVQPAIGSTAGDVYRMKIDVIPAPGAFAAFGVLGLAVARRRR